MKKNILILFAAFALLAIVASCKKPKSDIGGILFKESRNKIFKRVDLDDYAAVFDSVLKAEKKNLTNPVTIRKFYQDNENDAYFIAHFAPKEHLKTLLDYYAKAPEHGLSPDYFNYTELKPLIDKLYDKHAIKTVNEAYRVIAHTELLVANSLLNYSSAIQFGVVNPRKTFSRYYMKTARPDSAFYQQVFTVQDVKSYLDSIQPKSSAYIKIQDALKNNTVYQGLTAEETRKTFELALERLRWRNKPSAKRYVWVNIADFTLHYFENGAEKLSMKVCAGKGPDQEDGPHNHQTPQLSSEIYNAQVNPVWNIPQSIAKNEILEHVKADPYYLVNNGINVYAKSGEKLDAESIDWSSVSASDMPYKFKQAPGNENSLGRIKFQFPNGSSVYLHDTPAQEPFKMQVRAVSHGCVRVEKPLELARALYGDGKKFQLIEKEMNEDIPTVNDIALTPKVPVYLDYMPCFVDSRGNIRIVPDVYKLDAILYNRMKQVLY
ncbi:L,D-transpeptidase family protein [Pedobacter sp. BS3]|uniref:L,D-transpeptidase family protein n=1 Tax=Pedobacter sp. BS3 TaxID=2567937 RepID=UPI001659A58B|nr:L,D-transpeptidase family protein [Pedobacter sp. BS3]